MSTDFETGKQDVQSSEQLPGSSKQPVASPACITGRGSALALLAIFATVILADITIYRTEGWFGPAVFFPAAAVLVLISDRSFFGTAILERRCRSVSVRILAAEHFRNESSENSALAQ